MKRDMELIRTVLLMAESGRQNADVVGYSEDQVKYHRALAIEAGLLKGQVLKDYQSMTEIPAAVMVRDLTWGGHDFLDAIASDTNWAKVKDYLAAGGKQLTIDTIKYAVVQLFRIIPT